MPEVTDSSTLNEPQSYWIKNDQISVEITNYGGKLMKLLVPNKTGTVTDVALGYDDAKTFLHGDPYFGATIGRFGNRIKEGKFHCPTDDGGSPTLVTLKTINNGPNHLHGGTKGFHNVFWNVLKQEPHSLELEYTSEEGEEGYPGEVYVVVKYELTKQGLSISYRATTTKTTPLNLTNHTFFNLHEDHTRDILDHELQIESDKYLPIDDTSIPLGTMDPVDGGPFDFRQFKPIGQDIAKDDEQLKVGNGYDHTFVLRGEPGELREVATLQCADTGIKMKTLTTAPGMQLYTGNFLNASEPAGKKNIKYDRRCAVCLETQNFPDGVNQFPEYHPYVFLKPGDEWSSQTIYEFSVM